MDAYSKIKVLSWNIEGAKRGSANLAHFVKTLQPALIFLSEPQLFQCDASLALAPLLPTFCYKLNSQDSYYPELALEQRQAHGGTLAMWHSALDPFVSLLPTSSPAVLPLLLSIPGLSKSVHIVVYLPTSGRDEDFVIALASLTAVLDSLLEDHLGVPVFIRGDCNVNPNNLPRVQLLTSFQTKYSLKNLPLNHPTHHHFMGNGESDSQLDIIMYSDTPHSEESLDQVICGKENPLVTSHHDVVVSTFPSSTVPYMIPPPAVKAPRIPNTRVKVLWNQDGQEMYENMLSSTLPLLEQSLLNPSSPSLTSILLNCTNYALNRAAEISFKTVQMSKPRGLKKVSECPEIKKAQVAALKASRDLLHLQSSASSPLEEILAATARKSSCSSALRAAIRASSSQAARERDKLLHSVLSSDPRKLQAAVRSSKNSSSPIVHTLQVGNHIYSGDSVPDGFYEALLNLKVPNSPSDHPGFLSSAETFRHILEVAKTSPPLPALSPQEAYNLLKRVRSDVLDLFSISARHYCTAGVPGVQHFTALLNLIISNINLSSAPELNSAWSIMLYKGHNKPRTLCRSWRCISSCPLISKVLDLYVSDLHRSGWSSASAPTQFMTRGSSHELAALLLTEAISYATV